MLLKIWIWRCHLNIDFNDWKLCRSDRKFSQWLDRWRFKQKDWVLSEYLYRLDSSSISLLLNGNREILTFRRSYRSRTPYQIDLDIFLTWDAYVKINSDSSATRNIINSGWVALQTRLSYVQRSGRRKLRYDSCSWADTLIYFFLYETRLEIWAEIVLQRFMNADTYPHVYWSSWSLWWSEIQSENLTYHSYSTSSFEKNIEYGDVQNLNKVSK